MLNGRQMLSAQGLVIYKCNDGSNRVVLCNWICYAVTSLYKMTWIDNSVPLWFPFFRILMTRQQFANGAKHKKLCTWHWWNPVRLVFSRLVSLSAQTRSCVLYIIALCTIWSESPGGLQYLHMKLGVGSPCTYKVMTSIAKASCLVDVVR